MSEFERRTIGSFIKLLIPVVALALFMVPSATNAEPLLLLHDTVVGSHPGPDAARQSVKRPVNIGINENGDLVIRRSKFLLTVAPSPPKDFIEPQGRIRIAQRLDYPSGSGISLTVCFPF